VGSSPSEQGYAYTQLAADQVAATRAVAKGQVQMQRAHIGTRLARIRQASRNPAALQPYGLVNAQGLQAEFGGAAGDDDMDSFDRLGGFFNLKYRTGNQDKTTNEAGFDYSGWGLTAGADYKLTNNVVAGLSISYLDDSVEYDDNRGDMDSKSWGANLYGTLWLADGLYVEGILGYNRHDHSMERRINYTVGTTTINQIASADPNGNQFSASLGGGYDTDFNGFGIKPAVRLDYFSNKMDDYTESMSDPTGPGGSLALTMDSVTYTSLTSHVGAALSRAISFSSGILVPQLQFEWIHEFKTDDKKLGGRFINDHSGTPVLVLTDNEDSDYYNLGVSVSGQFANGKSAFVSYDTLLGLKDVTHHSINAGLRIEF
jgi:outer membrane autotransporter protein